MIENNEQMADGLQKMTKTMTKCRLLQKLQKHVLI